MGGPRAMRPPGPLGGFAAMGGARPPPGWRPPPPGMPGFLPGACPPNPVPVTQARSGSTRTETPDPMVTRNHLPRPDRRSHLA